MSVRTPAEPMAFAGSEFIGGLLRVWLGCLLLIFVPALILTGFALTIAFPFLVIALVPITLAVLVFAPVAFVLGRSLRRIERRGVHIAAFTALGLVSGFLTVFVFAWSTTGNLEAFAYPAFLPFYAVPAIIVPLAWALTSRSALKRDATEMTSPAWSQDPDAAAEDAAAQGQASSGA